MKNLFRIFGVFVAVFIFIVGVFYINKNKDNVSLITNESMPFMGNNSINYGGINFSEVTDISNTSTAAKIKEKFDDISIDFLTMLKIDINISKDTLKVNDIYLSDITNDDKVTEFVYYYDYYSSDYNKHFYGTDKTNDKLLAKFKKGDKITIYFVPLKDIVGSSYNFVFKFNNINKAYTQFALYNINYSSLNINKDYTRTISSYTDEFNLDKVDLSNTDTFQGWATDKTISSNKVKYSNGQSFDDVSELMSDYKLDLIGVYGDGETLSYTVRYNKGDKSARLISGATPIDEKTYSLDDTITIENNVFVRDYYNFVSWTLNSNDPDASLTSGDSVKISDIVGYANSDNIINIYAKWDPIIYTIKYDANGGNGTLNDTKYTMADVKVSLRVVNDKSTNTDNNIYREGYEFIGYSKDKDASEATYAPGERPAPNKIGPGDMTLYAIWKSNSETTIGDDTGDNPPSGGNDPITPGTQYTVIFDSNGGTGSMSNDSVHSSESYTLPDCSYTKSGFTFGGWLNGSTTYKAGDQIKDLSNLSITGNNITFVAVWEGSGYKLSFDPNGGNGTMASMNYEVGGLPLIVPGNEFTYPGYNFMGWSTTSDGDPSSEYAPNSRVMLDKDIKLYAVWDPVYYYIIYHSNATVLEDGTSDVTGSMEETEARYGENVTLRKNSFVHSDSNYAFAGWSTSPKGTVYYVDQAVVSNLTDINDDEIDLYAIWVEKKQFTITFNKNGGNGSMKSMDASTYTDIDLEKNSFEKTGYKFIGWATEENGEVVYKDGETINVRDVSSDNLVLYAVWKRVSDNPTNVVKNNGKTIIENPVTGSSTLIILIVIISCFVANYVYRKRSY